MDAAIEPTPRPVWSAFLAGLQGGMVAAFWMLIWLGISAIWMRRSFWSAANIMATALKGDAAITPGFGSGTISGIALYLMLYSLLGAAFAVLFAKRLTGLGTFLVSILFALAWYWLWFRLIAARAMPLIWLLHPEKATQFGHVIFGAILARFSDYLPRPPLVIPVLPECIAEGAD